MGLPVVKNIYPVEVMADISIRRSDLKKLLVALDNAEIDAGSNSESAEAERYVREDFFPWLSQLLDEMS